MIYISLLRGINVSGQKKIKMVELRAMYEQLGFEDVVSYIQSGNLIFKTKKTKVASLEKKIHEAIQKTFGFEVPIVVLTRDQLQAIVDNNPYKDREVDNKALYFTILATPPEEEKIATVQAIEFPGEEFTVTKEVVYLYVPKGYGRTKLSNNFFEAKLKVKATSRNLRSTLKLLELSARC